VTTLSTLLDDAGLTGRGGADFRTGAKVAVAAQHGADLIVNACDGELGAAKDAWVITHHLAEMLAGAQAVTRGSIQVAASRDSAVLAQLRAQGVATLAVPRRYVASEESSLVSLAHGGLARPFMRSAPVVTGSHDRRGRRFRPTLVLNAETVWRLSQIMDRGVRWFRSFGTAAEPGPRLVTLVNGVARPGVYDAEAGLTVEELLSVGGGPVVEVAARWFGGLGGGFLPAHQEAGVRWSRAGLAPFGIAPGSGVVDVIDARADPWREVEAALDYAAGESAGQCGPCMFGVPGLRDAVAALRRSPTPQRSDQVKHRVRQLAGRGACHYPDGVAGFVDSALRALRPVEVGK